MMQIALTIAGSDSGGGAGIQADLKTFAFHRVHGASAVTCVTAQNTVGVTQVAAMTTSIVEAQIEAVVTDLSVDAIKTGMLLNGEIIEVVAAAVKKNNLPPLVVDPVMVSRAGVRLIDDDAIAILKKLLIPQATIVTPNRYEAQILSEMTIDTLEEAKEAARAIQERLGVKVVLVKGGGLKNSDKPDGMASQRGVDIYYDGQETRILATKTIATHNTHGTGCTLSAAICANLALKKDLYRSVVAAKEYVTSALEYSLNIGGGNGPVGHFFPLIKNL